MTYSWYVVYEMIGLWNDKLLKILIGEQVTNRKKWLMHLEMTGEQNGWLFKWLLDEINVLWNDLFMKWLVY